MTRRPFDEADVRRDAGGQFTDKHRDAPPDLDSGQTGPSPEEIADQDARALGVHRARMIEAMIAVNRPLVTERAGTWRDAFLADHPDASVVLTDDDGDAWITGYETADGRTVKLDPEAEELWDLNADLSFFLREETFDNAYRATRSGSGRIDLSKIAPTPDPQVAFADLETAISETRRREEGRLMAARLRARVPDLDAVVLQSDPNDHDAYGIAEVRTRNGSRIPGGMIAAETETIIHASIGSYAEGRRWASWAAGNDMPHRGAAVIRLDDLL